MLVKAECDERKKCEDKDRESEIKSSRNKQKNERKKKHENTKTQRNKSEEVFFFKKKIESLEGNAKGTGQALATQKGTIERKQQRLKIRE